MKNVEIKTSQNVVLQYELASLQDRVLAFILDLSCMVGVSGIMATVFAGIFSYSSTAMNVVLLILTGLFCFYSLAFEFFNDGKSIGKMAMRIQVIKLEGGRATFSDYAARWVFRLIDVYFSLGGIASILIMSSGKAQRIGDIIANTVVIKTKPRTNIDLEDLLSIHESKYTPAYQQARKLREQDALLIKTTLERYRRFHNESHEEAVKQLTAHIQQMLRIDGAIEKKYEFLQTILKDYVVLSR